MQRDVRETLAVTKAAHCAMRRVHLLIALTLALNVRRPIE